MSTPSPSSSLARPLRHADILAIALPLIVSNVSTPLLGLVDTGVIGNQGRADYIGAVAVGAAIATALYWMFNFLQLGTSGLTAQADGANAPGEIRATLQRGLALAGAIGLALIVLQWPLIHGALALMGAPASETALAQTYLGIRIWTAPAALANLVLLGWFIGRRAARTALLVQVFLNCTNLALNLLFVVALGFGVAGIAFGTVIAEALAAALGLALVARRLKKDGHGSILTGTRAALGDVSALRRTVALNRDIFIRTLCLLFAFNFFTAQGARLGTVPLAANAILMQLITASAFLLDGFTAAVESLTGQAVGARDRGRILAVLRLGAVWAAGTAAAIALLFWFAGEALIALITNVPDVRALAGANIGWLALAPLFGIWSFLLDSLFFGATRGPQMRNAAIAALAVFLAAWWLLMPRYGLDGLWGALMVYYVARFGFLAVQTPQLLADAAPAPTASATLEKPAADSRA